MKRSDIYQSAAELIDSGRQHWCCVALECRNYPCRDFVSLFKPTGSGMLWRGLSYSSESCAAYREARESRKLRVLMLCLMAAIAYEEEKHVKV